MCISCKAKDKPIHTYVLPGGIIVTLCADCAKKHDATGVVV